MPKIEIEISEELKAFLDKEGVEAVRFGTVKKEELYIDTNSFGKLILGNCNLDKTIYEYLVVRKKLKWPPFLERTFAKSFYFCASHITLFDEEGLWCGSLNMNAVRKEDLKGFKSDKMYYKKDFI